MNYPTPDTETEFGDDHQARLFNKWLPWLMEFGGDRQKCARQIGKLRKTWKDVYVNSAFATAHEERAIDPYPFVIGYLQTRCQRKGDRMPTIKEQKQRGTSTYGLKSLGDVMRELARR